jgi:hypothetical protein
MPASFAWRGAGTPCAGRFGGSFFSRKPECDFSAHLWFCGIIAAMTFAASPKPSSVAARANVPACAHCQALGADSRRREPHERLTLRHTAPLVSESAAGVPFSMLTFQCRDCGTVWRLYDRANELFVSWVPDRLLGE